MKSKMAEVSDWDKSAEGKELKRLERRKKANKTTHNHNEDTRLAQLDAVRRQLVSERDAAKQSKKDADDRIKTYKEDVKNDENSYWHILRIIGHWKEYGKCKGAYHGGTWNEKDA